MARQPKPPLLDLLPPELCQRVFRALTLDSILRCCLVDKKTFCALPPLVTHVVVGVGQGKLLRVMAEKRCSLRFDGAEELLVQSFIEPNSNQILEQLQWLSSNGAALGDPRWRDLLVKKPTGTNVEAESLMIGFEYFEKRLLDVKTFRQLRELGFSISQADFELIDPTDPAHMPSYNRPENLAREARYIERGTLPDSSSEDIDSDYETEHP